MKRLLKKSEFNPSEFLTRLVNYNAFSQEQVEEIISENPDCSYSGDAYRILFFDKSEFKDAEIERRKNNETPFWGAIDRMIRTHSNFQSFAKTEKGINTVTNNFSDNDEYGDVKIIIKFNIQNGLDIEKFYEKYQSQLTEQAISAYNDHSEEEEVLGKMNSNDYEVVNTEELIDTYYRM